MWYFWEWFCVGVVVMVLLWWCCCGGVVGVNANLLFLMLFLFFYCFMLLFPCVYDFPVNFFPSLCLVVDFCWRYLWRGSRSHELL